jgi:hypothetical protein
MSPYFYISTAQFMGNTVFILEDCCALCNTVHLVYNCSGKKIGYVSYYSLDAKPIKLGTETVAPIYYGLISATETILWKPDTFRCTPYPQ